MTDIRVEIDTTKLEEALDRKAEAIDANLRAALKAGSTLVVSGAKKSHAFNDREGRLRGSFRAAEPYDDGEDLAVDMLAGSAEVSYAPYIEFGTKHIAARRPMGDALDAHEGAIGEIIKVAFEEGLKA